MPNAIKLVLTDFGPNAAFPNNFKLQKAQNSVQLVNGDNWFYIDTALDGFETAYLYFTSKVTKDLDVTAYRSVAITSEDIVYAVPIPGANLILVSAAPNIAAADFSMSLFGANRIWLKITVAGLAQGEVGLEDLALMVKR